MKYRIIAYNPETKREEDCGIIEADTWKQAHDLVCWRYNYPRRMIEISEVPKDRCRYCGKSGATVRTLAYWQQTPDLCHPECQKSGERQEAIDCQVIDADCNDCVHFRRAAIIGGVPKAVSGHCTKFNQPATAYPHYWTGRPCFEHRRLTTTP